MADAALGRVQGGLGVVNVGASMMFGDNEAVIKSSTIPHSKLTKRHSILSHHRVREAIAGKIVRFYHVPGVENPADVLSKHWGYQAIWPVLQPPLFWKGDIGDIEAQS